MSVIIQPTRPKDSGRYFAKKSKILSWAFLGCSRPGFLIFRGKIRKYQDFKKTVIKEKIIVIRLE